MYVTMGNEGMQCNAPASFVLKCGMLTDHNTDLYLLRWIYNIVASWTNIYHYNLHASITVIPNIHDK